MVLLQWLRTLLFYVLFGIVTALWALLCIPLAPLLPYAQRYELVSATWSRIVLWLAWHVVGVRYRVSGASLPPAPFVMLSKHQSTWETLFLSAHYGPLCQVLKRELLRIPFFGWGLALIKPIALDRSQPKLALRQLSEQGAERLGQGLSILIFPEGTRLPSGQLGAFSRGGAALAARAGCPVVPVALNSGRCWPRAGWFKHPGTIEVVVGPALYAENTSGAAIAELNQRAFAWVQETQARIDGPLTLIKVKVAKDA